MNCDRQKTHRLTNDGFTNTHAERMGLDGLCLAAAAAAAATTTKSGGGGGGGCGGGLNTMKINFSGTSTSETLRPVIFSMFAGYAGVWGGVVVKVLRY
jgi:hypothetical protein